MALPLPIPLTAFKVVVPATTLTAAPLKSVMAPLSAVSETARFPLLRLPIAISPPAATSVTEMLEVAVLSDSRRVTAVRRATPLNVPASPELSPVPSADVVNRMLVVMVAVATKEEFVIDPRSPSKPPSLSAIRLTMCSRTPSVVSIDPELPPSPKTMSSPAVNVNMESAAAPFKVTMALLLIVRSSSAAAESPAVKLMEALVLTFALMVRGLIALMEPPAARIARALPYRFASVSAPVFVILRLPKVSISIVRTLDVSVTLLSERSPSRFALSSRAPPLPSTISAPSSRRSPATDSKLATVKVPLLSPSASSNRNKFTNPAGVTETFRSPSDSR